MLVQVYDLQHSGLLLLKWGLSVARMCETVVLRMCETVVLRMCETVVLRMCETVVLRMCETVVLRMCETVVLRMRETVVLRMCEIVINTQPAARPAVVQGKGQLLSILSRMRISWDSLI